MKIFITGAIGAIAVAGAFLAPAANAVAGEALPQAIARQLDKQDAEFTMTDAKRRRLEYMQMEAARSQARAGHGPGRGYDRGPRYGDRGGYGPRRGYYGRNRDWDRTW